MKHSLAKKNMDLLCNKTDISSSNIRGYKKREGERE